MSHAFPSFLALFLLASLPALSQAPPSSRNAQSVKKDLLFEAVELSSSRYPDQADSDLANREDPVWTLDMEIKAEAKPEAWRKARSLILDTLAKAGLVPLSRGDLDRLPKMHRVEMPDAEDPSLVLRPRDQASFAALLTGVEVLGDREVGRRTYAFRNYFLQVDALSIEFTPRNCWMKLRLRNLLMGCISEEDGKKKSITDGELIEENNVITRKLTARLRGMLDSALD